jgi:hypothetical protein
MDFIKIINSQYECNYVLFFEFLSHFPHNKIPMMIKDFYNLFKNDIAYGLNISQRMHCRFNMKERRFITIQETRICEKA